MGQEREVLGHQERAEELRGIFEKKGYPGYLRKDAEIYEAEGDFYDAGTDHALLGEKDAAFADLQKAVDEGQQVDDMKLDPELDNVRSDPRFADLLRRIGLPQKCLARTYTGSRPDREKAINTRTEVGRADRPDPNGTADSATRLRTLRAERKD